jgi:hypothetical protein
MEKKSISSTDLWRELQKGRPEICCKVSGPSLPRKISHAFRMLP